MGKPPARFYLTAVSPLRIAFHHLAPQARMPSFFSSRKVKLWPEKSDTPRRSVIVPDDSFLSVQVPDTRGEMEPSPPLDDHHPSGNLRETSEAPASRTPQPQRESHVRPKPQLPTSSIPHSNSELPPRDQLRPLSSSGTQSEPS